MDEYGRKQEVVDRGSRLTRRRVVVTTVLGAAALVVRPSAARADDVVLECLADLRGV